MIKDDFSVIIKFYIVLFDNRFLFRICFISNIDDNDHCTGLVKNLIQRAGNSEAVNMVSEVFNGFGRRTVNKDRCINRPLRCCADKSDDGGFNGFNSPRAIVNFDHFNTM